MSKNAWKCLGCNYFCPSHTSSIAQHYNSHDPPVSGNMADILLQKDKLDQLYRSKGRKYEPVQKTHFQSYFPTHKMDLCNYIPHSNAFISLNKTWKCQKDTFITDYMKAGFFCSEISKWRKCLGTLTNLINITDVNTVHHVLHRAEVEQEQELKRTCVQLWVKRWLVCVINI